MYSKRCNIALYLCILLHLIYHKDKTGVVYSKRCTIVYVIAYCCIRYITRTKLVLCIQIGAISHYAFAYRCICYITRPNWCCVFKFETVQYRLMSLYIAASDMSQGQNWCCVFKKMKNRPISLHIAASDISQGQKNGVVYSKRCNIAYVIAYCCIRYIIRTNLVLCIQKGAISPMSLHFATADISQGQKTGVVYSKRCNIALCLCLSLHLLYHKDKTDVVYSNSKRCSIALCLCILLHLIYHKDKTGVVYSKRCNIALCLCILLHLIYLTTKET